MLFENQANEQKHLDNQLCLNIRFSTSSASNQQSEIAYSEILQNDRQPFHPEKTSLHQNSEYFRPLCSVSLAWIAIFPPLPRMCTHDLKSNPTLQIFRNLDMFDVLLCWGNFYILSLVLSDGKALPIAGFSQKK